MKLSYVIITRNRRDRLLKSLRILLETTPLAEGTWETLVVDNASDDDTPAAVRRKFPDVRVIELDENEGMPARNHGIARSAGRYIAFLDDDSYPAGDTVTSAVRYLSRHAQTAALVARVVLPSGDLEAPAFPGVTLGGASIVRKSVLDQVGGFAPEFFRQAEEYDLSFRIWNAGYKIERFEDLVFRHDKEPGGRNSAAIHQFDLRNNLILVERYLPRNLRGVYRADWIRRYATIAIEEGHRDAVKTALREARVWARREALVGRKTLSSTALEHLFDLQRQADAVRAWSKREGKMSRVVIADFSKNIYATYRACRLENLEVVAIVDPRHAFAATCYRGVPILADADAQPLRPDGIVLSTVNPALVDSRIDRLRETFKCSILRLWEPKYLDRPPRDRREAPGIAAA
jgi:GT2 family glycosyltransferase